MPKTHGSLYPQICDFQNLHRAFIMASRAKRETAEVLRFAQNLEENLIILQNELIWHAWNPRPYRHFLVREPKAREIRAPDFRDRVVHHALVQVIEPFFERKMISASFACRANMGTHAAVAKARAYIRACHARWGDFYVLKADVSKYFYSVDHAALKRIVRRTIRCPDTLWLIDKIIDHGGEDGVGIPIGALTSQLFANVYLDALDHFCKETLREHYYLRYMDDFVVLHPSKRHLHQIKEHVEAFLRDELCLTLNPKTAVFPWRHGLNFCGYRLWPTHTLPRKNNVRRMTRRLKRMAKLRAGNRIPREKVEAVLMSWLGYMQHCDGYRTTELFLRKFRI